MNEDSKNQIDAILLILHEYRGKARSILKKGCIDEDIEDALSDSILKVAKQLHSGTIPLGKPKDEYLKLFTTISRRRLIDMSRRGIGRQQNKQLGDSPPPIDPIDLRHRAPNRLRIQEIDELVSDQDVFAEATRKNVIHVSQTLLDDVMCASSKAGKKVTQKYLELLATKQEDVTQADVARECNMSRANITITLKKVREDVTKRHPDILENYYNLFAV